MIPVRFIIKGYKPKPFTQSQSHPHTNLSMSKRKKKNISPSDPKQNPDNYWETKQNLEKNTKMPIPPPRGRAETCCVPAYDSKDYLSGTLC